MKKDQTESIFAQLEQARYTHRTTEYWSARELLLILEYTSWETFFPVIHKAINACKIGGAKTSIHFIPINQVIDLANGNKLTLEDFSLTRYAAFLIAKNADVENENIAPALSYFAVSS